MSIIHDALKKVQQGLNAKPEASPTSPSATTSSGYIYAASHEPVEALAPGQKIGSQRPAIVKSLLILMGTLIVVVAAGFYLWQQIAQNAPKVQILAAKTVNQLIHQIPLAHPKNPPLQSLGQLTVSTPTAKPSAPLNIHGIMADPRGNLVLINDQVYQEGDEVNGAKILKIGLDSITVLNNGTEQTIFLKD